MAESNKQLALQALRNMKGDDTIRARNAFRGMSTEQMREQHGFSGKTRAEILNEYIDYDAKVDAAIAWVNQQPEG